MRRKPPRHATVAIIRNGAPRAGLARSIVAGKEATATKSDHMRKEYLMNESDLKWNLKREKYRKMLADYRAKGGVVTRLPGVAERRIYTNFSFVIGPAILRRPGYSPRIEECRNAPKPVKNG